MGRNTKMKAMKINDIIIIDSTSTTSYSDQVHAAIKKGFEKVYGNTTDEDLAYFTSWFADFVYRRYRESFILSYVDEDMAWNKIYDFYASHISEFRQVDALWEENKENLMNGFASKSTIVTKGSDCSQDGTDYIDNYPETESKQTSESFQGDKSVLKKLQELTKQYTNYKKTWAEMFRKEMGLWTAL